MPRIVFGGVVALVIASASGCGILADSFAGPYPPVPYSATKMDVAAVDELYSEGSALGIGCSIFWVADMPISAAADTINLPFVYLHRALLEKWSKDRDESLKASDQNVSPVDRDLKENATDR